MTTIKVSELHPAGYDLLAEPESYMNQLDDNELDSISGGEEFTNDWGDVFGGLATATAAATGVAGAVGASLASPVSNIGCVGAAYSAAGSALGASAAASAMTHD